MFGDRNTVVRSQTSIGWKKHCGQVTNKYWVEEAQWSGHKQVFGGRNSGQVPNKYWVAETQWSGHKQVLGGRDTVVRSQTSVR